MSTPPVAPSHDERSDMPHSPSETYDSGGVGLSLFGLARFVVRNLHILILVPLLVASLQVSRAVLFGRSYTATSTILPESTDGGMGGYSALAAQFGVALGGPAGATVEFYEVLLRSPAVAKALANSRFEFADSDTAVAATLGEILAIDAPTEHRRSLRTVRAVQDMIDVTANSHAGTLDVQTTADWIPLSEMMNRRLLEIVDSVNVERRRSMAATEETFLAQRIQDATTELAAAERQLSSFLEANRTYQSSPELMFTAARLQRQVEVRQQIYLSLAQVHESARLGALRNVPAISIINPPEGTADRQRLLLIVIIWGLLGGILALLIIGIREWVARERMADPGGYERLRADLRARRGTGSRG
jgi:hypothetical protein